MSKKAPERRLIVYPQIPGLNLRLFRVRARSLELSLRAFVIVHSGGAQRRPSRRHRRQELNADRRSVSSRLVSSHFVPSLRIATRGQYQIHLML